MYLSQYMHFQQFLLKIMLDVRRLIACGPVYMHESNIIPSISEEKVVSITDRMEAYMNVTTIASATLGGVTEIRQILAGKGSSYIGIIPGSDP